MARPRNAYDNELNRILFQESDGENLEEVNDNTSDI